MCIDCGIDITQPPNKARRRLASNIKNILIKSDRDYEKIFSVMERNMNFSLNKAFVCISVAKITNKSLLSTNIFPRAKV